MGGTLYSYAALPDRSPTPDMRRRINRLLEHQKEQVSKLLADHADLVHAVAQRLLEKDELTGEELEELAEQYPPRSGVVDPPAIEESIYPEPEVAVSAEEESQEEPTDEALLIAGTDTDAESTE